MYIYVKQKNFQAPSTKTDIDLIFTLTKWQLLARVLVISEQGHCAPGISAFCLGALPIRITFMASVVPRSLSPSCIVWVLNSPDGSIFLIVSIVVISIAASIIFIICLGSVYGRGQRWVCCGGKIICEVFGARSKKVSNCSKN